jgi:4-hydroxy-tetrahydrodipicolinate synthase
MKPTAIHSKGSVPCQNLDAPQPDVAGGKDSMRAGLLRLPLTGIIPPMVTPLRDWDTLDVEGLERLVHHILAGGVHGLFILGTTGEGPSLSYRLRRELIQRTCALVNGRVPVLVGITDTAFVESVNLARHAAEAGSAAVVTTPPYYMPGGQAELQEWLDHLVARLPLPLYIYNMPALTKVAFELETVRLALDHPHIVGLKDSSADLDYVRQACALASARPDWSVLIGPQEILLTAARLGAGGGVSGGANVFPQVYAQLWQAVRSGDTSRAAALNEAMKWVADALFHVGRHPSSLIKGLKCALAVMGICNDFMAEPFHRFRAEERARLDQNLDALRAKLAPLGVLPAKAH